ncbi:MAG: hypothetical protein ABJA67_03450 [Chthonomonadales bacterium]
MIANRKLILFFPVLAVLLSTAISLSADTRPDQREKAYAAVCARMARAKTLHVKVQDGLTKIDSEYWFMKPNRFKMVSSNGIKVTCDGKQMVTISKDKTRKVEPAPKGFSEEIRLMDFRSFFESKPYTYEMMGAQVFEFRGKKYKTLWLKTTESAIEYGQAFIHPVSMIPLGHHTTLKDEVETDLYYPLVEINPELNKKFFAAPGT